MSKGFKLLRVEYIFTVEIPLLVAIYLNGYAILDHLMILAAFGFWAICGNTLNDFFDMDNPDDKETLERTDGYRKKEIAAISVTAFLLGCMCFMNAVLTHPEIALYLIVIVALVVLYCAALKPLVVMNWIVLGISHIWLPYFIIKINAGDSLNGFPIVEPFEWFLLACASTMALAGNLFHEIIDGETITKYPLKTQQIIIWATSIGALALGALSLLLFPEQTIYFAPFVLFPIECLFMARTTDKIERKKGRTSLKDTGIIAGNLVFIFVIILVITQPI